MGSYTPTTWNDGTSPAITAAQLNRIETGVAAAHTELNAGGTGSANSNMFFRRDGTLTVQEGNRFRIRYPFTFKEISVDLDTAGSGATLLQVTVYKDGVSVYDRTVAASSTSASNSSQNVAFAAGDRISIGISQQDSNKAAVGLSVVLGVQYA